MKQQKTKTLIIVDMQNDFITGSLANQAAQAIVKPICNLIKGFDGNIICTRDTHDDTYMDSPEGKGLPIEHCIIGEDGWEIQKDIKAALEQKTKYKTIYVNKPTFGFNGWMGYKSYLGDEIYVVGTCTDICVISNVMILKSLFPEKSFCVLEAMCAGLTKKSHKSAIEVMQNCQIEIDSRFWV